MAYKVNDKEDLSVLIWCHTGHLGKKKKVYAAYPINPTLEHDVSANVSYSYGKQESNLSIKPSRVHYNLLIALFTIQ